MSKVGFSTGKGFHELAGVIAIEKTFSGLVKGTAVVVDALPFGRTIDDLIGISFQSPNVFLSCFGGRKSGKYKYFQCSGMAGLADNYMILESVDITIAADGDNFTFAVTDGYSFNSDGTANEAMNSGYYGNSLFNTGSNSNITFTFYFK